ncbi:helix-turn-helix domain-containing protein [Bacillus carboniphilus]|uniref:Helix-turn-helix domain-containing protein n=1 Tax=Bacillus carboniphilus TaxID=86663 RepID=A0ABY9JVQ5_9BACI|nr:RodZ domain-containing protein [Bacillus carboniphilus]WLR43482.1 helix-turn-helix domain-containing protein [Bacillus carboniphilus]
MGELGNRLKEARVEKNYTLDDIQRLTKIQKRYLIAIEEGNYDILPGKFYIRAFIKQYAEAVDLDVEELFQEFQKEIPSTNNQERTDVVAQMHSTGELSKPFAKLLDLLPKLFVWIIIIMILVFIYWAFRAYWPGSSQTSPEEKTMVEQSSELNNEESDQEEPAEKPVDEEQDQPEEEEKTPEVDLKVGEAESGFEGVYELLNADSFEVEIEAVNSKTWVRITNDNEEKLFEGEIPEGEKRNIPLKDSSFTTIRIGSIPNTIIKVNGINLEYQSEDFPQNIKIINKQAEQ